MTLLLEANLKTVSKVTGSLVRAFNTPNPSAQTVSPSLMRAYGSSWSIPLGHVPRNITRQVRDDIFRRLINPKRNRFLRAGFRYSDDNQKWPAPDPEAH